ncbi:MAG TPA: hypothetical protein VM871_12330 [Flavisolibacter sp.]|jgi:hypothetical protein|nr:hypothetical protein [Flavisolibacter sp.]
MKTFLSLCFSCLTLVVSAQLDSVRKIEPDQETSFENYELLVIALLGLALLMGIRFWFKKTRNR